MRRPPSGKPTIRIALLGGVLVAGVVASVPSASIPSPSGSSGGFAWCTGSSPVLATQLPDRLDLASCPIAGRTVVVDASPGSAGVVVPRPGLTVGVAAVGATGEQSLQITNDGTRLTIVRAPADTHQAATTSMSKSCSESTYQLTDRGAARWSKKLTWHYNSGTTARARLDPTKALRNIRLANTNLTANISGCSDGGFGAWGSYQGTTGKYANVDGYGRCTSKFPDGQNTISWGTLSGTSALAVTCFAYTADGMVEADTYIGANRSIVNKLPGRCSNRWDLQSVMTHEWGHAFGLAHVADSDLTMHTYVGPCSYRARSLGYGDERGMRTLYGPR